jgi:RNA polymerase sigma factor (sigma-70 family)
MNDPDWHAQQFEETRPHLRTTAYRMLGSTGEADVAVQEAWIRFARADTEALDNLRGWLTTVVSRVCLDMLRSRRARQEQLVELPHVTLDTAVDPEEAAVLADSVGVALLVVLETLSPVERLAFVLHDMFGVSFAEIAPIVERTPAATRQLASRARRRVRGQEPVTTAESLARQREVIDAFLTASRDGDFDALVAVLHPDVVFKADLRLDLTPGSVELTGSARVANVVLARGTPFAPYAQPAVVDGQAGVVVVVEGRLRTVVKFTISDDRITSLDLTIDPDTLSRLHL